MIDPRKLLGRTIVATEWSHGNHFGDAELEVLTLRFADGGVLRLDCAAIYADDAWLDAEDDQPTCAHPHCVLPAFHEGDHKASTHGFVGTYIAFERAT